MKNFILQNSLTDEILFNDSQTPAYSLANPFKIRHNYSNIEDILKKPYAQRNHKQLMTISKFVNKNEWFSKIVQQFGIQIAKGLMRNAKIQQINPNMLIHQLLQPIQGVMIVLQGKLVLYKQQNVQTSFEIPKNQVFERIMHNIRLQNKQKKKTKQKQQKKGLLRKSSFISQFKYQSKVRQLSKDYQLGQVQQYISKNEQYGLRQKIKSNIHLNNVVSLQKTIVLYMPIEQIFNWLNYSFQQKLMESFSLVRQLECFKIFDDQEVQEIIQCMTLKKKAKGEYIYKQNQQSKFIYFLSYGEAKIVKEANLFVDNPNILYYDRQSLFQEFQPDTKQKKLPYASLSTLYNYRPTKKNIQMSVISPFCMFGEEQIFSKKHQTNVIVNSLHAFYYQLSLSKFMNFLFSKYHLFQKELLKSCRQKILRRQQIFAQALNMENKLHLDYFYIDENSQSKQVPKKYRIQKLNKKLNPTYSKSKAKLNVETEVQFLSPTQTTQTTDQITNQFKDVVQFNKISSKKVMPNITNFNFHRTLLYPKLKPVDLSLYSTKTKFKSPKSFRAEQKINPQNYQSSPIQEILFGNSHTWSIQKEIVKRQKDLAKKISPRKQKISFSNPLFDQKQLKHQEERSIQIQRDKRKIILKGYGQLKTHGRHE